jgi:hypothetical protein
MIQIVQYVELRGDNPLEAVVAETNANAHLVATAAMAQGVEETAEQYFISIAQVYGALAFYYENQDAIEQARESIKNDPTKKGISSKKFLEELKQRKATDET